jgi:chromatin remodeling complex protein RSC6
MSSTNVSASSMMNASKKVAKKTAAPAEVAVPAPVVTSTPAPAAPVKEKKVKASPAATTTASAVAVSEPTPSVTVATVVATIESAETTTLADEIKTLHDQLTTIRDAASSAISALKRIQKRASQDIKEASKKKRRARSEAVDGEPRKPSNFEIPIPITDELSTFLGGGKNNKMSRSQVTKAVNKYLNEKGLRTKHSITPDAALIKLLGVEKGTELTIFNIQTYLNKHYIKPAASATTTA